MGLPLTDINIKKQASHLISKNKITIPPIPVIDIAKKLSLEVIPYNLGDSASGILVIEDNKGTIGYNPNEPEVRQRFTIAHEIGHFILHHQKNESDSVFVDRDFLVKKYRSANNYNTAEFRQEQQANTFAAELLMPQNLILAELKKEDYTNLSETELEDLKKIIDIELQKKKK